MCLLSQYLEKLGHPEKDCMYKKNLQKRVTAHLLDVAVIRQWINVESRVFRALFLHQVFSRLCKKLNIKLFSMWS